jgi:hypothetical protein
VHQNVPVIFQTRWALSYLRGPLTREQIKALTPAVEASAASASPAMPKLAAASARPVLPPEVVQKFLAARGKPDGLMYYPELCVSAKIRFSDSKSKIDTAVDRVYLTPVKDDNTPVEWSESEVAELHPDELEGEPTAGIGYMELAGAATKAKNYAGWQKDLVSHIFANESLDCYFAPELKVYSNAGESEADFRGRISHGLHEERDAEIAKLQAKYTPKITAIEERIRKAMQAKEREEQQRSTQAMSAGLDILGGVLGAVFGRGKATIGKAASAAKKAGSVLKEQGDVRRAGETVEALQAQLAELEEQVEAETQALAAKMDAANASIESISIKPKKANISVGFTALVWAPYRPVEGGEAEKAW